MAALTRKIGRVKLKYRGPYDAGALYQALDWVSVDNGVAFCVVDNTTGVAPTDASPNWELVSASAAITGANEAVTSARQAVANADAASSSALAAARNTLSAVSQATSRVAGGGLVSYQNQLGVSVQKYLNIYNEDMAQMESVYWPWVVRVDDKLASPLGKYYMYYSTDHASNRGWIDMAYSNSLTSGWTRYGEVFRHYTDAGAPLETETPSIIWNEQNREFIMLFQSAASMPGEAQSSFRLTSADGITWENCEKLFDIDGTRIPGNLHNGYVMPFTYMGSWFAYSLMGGGNGGAALHWSEDGGYHWITDHRQLGRWNLADNDKWMYPNHCTVISLRGQAFLLGIQSNFASGTTAKIARIAMTPLADLRTPVGVPYVLVEPTETPYESVDLRTVTTYCEAGSVYIYYVCRASNKSYVNVAVMDVEAEATTETGTTVYFITQPQGVTVRAGAITGSLSASAFCVNGNAVSYQWYQNTRASRTGGTAISGAIQPALLLDPGLAMGVYYYYCVAISTSGASATSNVATVNVEPEAYITITRQPEDVTIHPGDRPVLVCEATTDNGAAVSYDWKYAMSGGHQAYGSRFIVPGTRPIGETCYKCVVTADGANPVTSRTVVVTVSSLSITLQPQAATYVLVGSVNASLSVSAETSDDTAITYQWYANTTASNVGGTPISDATAATLTIPADLISGTHYFYCVATNVAGASEASDVATVYAADSLEVVFSQQPQPVSVVSRSVSGTLSCSAMATDGSAVSYQWYRNSLSSTTGATLISGATSAEYALPADLTADAFFYCVAVSSTAGNAISEIVCVTVTASVNIAEYVLTGTPNAAIPATLPDTSGNSNAPVSVVGMTNYDGGGYLNIDGVSGNALKVTGLSLDGALDYIIHVRYDAKDDTTGFSHGVSHRLFFVAGVDFNILIASSANHSYDSLRVETSNPGYATTQSSSPGSGLNRANMMSMAMDIAVHNDVLTITGSGSTFDAGDYTPMRIENLSVSGFTAALQTEFYIGNRADGTRPANGRVTELVIARTVSA